LRPYRRSNAKSPKHSKGHLVIIGGAEDRLGRSDILRKFVQLSGRASARITVLTCASEFPKQAGREYVDAFHRLSARSVEVVDIHTRKEALSKQGLKIVQRSTGVFFTGGCQVRICSILGGTPMETILKQRYRDGLVIAGTSAGAAMMSDMMIARGESQTHPSVGIVELGYGLGFINDVVIDQHFAQRGRLGRLLSAVAQHPRHVGLGIDEDTALVVHNRIATVIGRGTVTIIDMHDSSFGDVTTDLERMECLALWNVRFHVIPATFSFDLKSRTVLQPIDGVTSRLT
jgi:cyanophycinase